jgi:hypothetical protein
MVQHGARALGRQIAVESGRAALVGVPLHHDERRCSRERRIGEELAERARQRVDATACPLS